MKVVLLFALLTCSANAEPAPADVVPANGPYSILLPTKAGRLPTGTVSPKFGLFPAAIVNCGKRTMSNTQLQTSFKKASSFEVFTDCTPTPTVVITGSGLTDKATAPLDLGNCIGTQTCSKPQAGLKKVPHGAASSAVADANRDKYADHKEMPNLCSSSLAPLLFSNEDGCAGNAYKVTEVTVSAAGQFPLPRWIGNADRFRVHNPWSHSRKGVPPAPPLPWTNAFIKFPEPNPAAPAKFRSCSATCDRGSIVKQTMAPKSWGMVLYLNGAADGFKMCFDAEHYDDDTRAPKCKQKAEIYVLLKQGAVVWPTAGGNGKASLIDLRPKAIGTGQYAIEIGYGVKEKSGGMRGEFYVGNMKREYVYSDTDGYQARAASRISFFFPSEDTLEKFGGISSQQITSGKAFVTEATAAGMEDEVVAQGATGGVAIDTAGENIEDDVVEERVPIILTTTPASVRIGNNIAAGSFLMATDNSNDAIYVPGKWWTWGVYIGFLVGTLVGFGIFGGIFYVLRRTIYSFWYRGMYKRYGCDASGTTGGITGVGFGKTTTGDMTIKRTGGTTGTTAGTTGTTGTTTGTRTKTSMSTTGNTIGM